MGKTKWPGVFRDNPKRRNEVIMRWREEDDHDEDGEGGNFKPKASAPNNVARSNIPKRAAVQVKKTIKKTFGSMSPKAKIIKGDRTSFTPYLKARVQRLLGKKVEEVLGTIKFQDSQGNRRIYNTS